MTGDAGSAPSNATAAVAIGRRRIVRAVVGSALVAAVFYWILYAGALPVAPPRDAFDGVQWSLVAAYAVLWQLVQLLRLGRWYWMLAPLGRISMKRVLLISYVSLGALVVLPFRLGEIVRPVLARREPGMSAMAAASTVGAERAIDGMALTAVLLLALPLAGTLDPLPSRIGNLPVPAAIVPTAAYAALAVFIAAFVAMGAFYWRRAFAQRMTHRIVGWVSPRWAETIARLVENAARGLEFLPQRRYSFPYLLVAAGYWALNIGSVAILMIGVGLESVTIARACVVIGVLALGLLLPNAPGFFGAFQLSIFGAAAMFYPPDVVMGRAAVFAFLLYVIQMVGALIPAFICALVLRRSREPAPQPEPDPTSA